MTELLISWVALNIVFNFDANQFKTDEQIGELKAVEQEIIGIDAVEGDVTFSADLGIASAWRFEVDREWFDLGLRTVLGDFFG